MEGQFRKTGTALTGCDVTGSVSQLRFKAADIGHACTERKVLEHHLVIGGVSHINPACQFGIQLTSPQGFQDPTGTA